MSLWTPDGERRVEREREPVEPAEDDPLAGLTDEQREQAMAMAAEMNEVRRQLAEAPAAMVVANHAMGLYELAAIHLSSEPPNFPEAQVAIDAMAAIVGALQGRLDEAEQTLNDALAQLKLAYVQLHGAAAPGE
jgi:cell division protein FtsN